jgi:hypothetical protein
VFFGFPPFESRAAAAEIWRVVERLLKNSSRLLVTCLQAVGIPLSKGPLKSVTIKNRSPHPMLNPCLHLFLLRKLLLRKLPQVPPEFLLTHPYSAKVLRLPHNIVSFDPARTTACGELILNGPSHPPLSPFISSNPQPELPKPSSHVFWRQRHQKRIHIPLVTLAQALDQDAPDGDQELECDGRINTRERRQPGLGNLQQRGTIQ